jgi:type III secretory pathway lipoprotein EscJ
LQKWLKVEFKVVLPGNQVEAQRESLPSVAVAFQQDAKDFQTTNHVLNQDATPRQFAIGMLLVFRESAFLRLLLWRQALVMQFV